MYSFACRNLGLDCDFVATGATPEEVKENAFAHAGVVHADLMQGMSEEQQAQLAQAVVSATKPV